MSNALASWAKSSSAVGNSRSLTDLTVTVTPASSPARAPATRVVGKVADPPFRQADDSFVETFDESAGADLAGQPLSRRLGISSPSMAAAVDRHEVTVLHRHARLP